MQDKLSRRHLLQNAAALGSLALFGATACSKSQPAAAVCTDTTGLAAADVAIRSSLAYVDVSMEPGKSCLTCQQFIAPPTAGTCGTCKVLKGPINATGYCKSFVPKTT